MEDWSITEPRPGEIYQHYKGDLYEVICVGRLSEKRDEIMVVYKSLSRGCIWIRPFGMWGEWIDWCPAPTGYPYGALTLAPYCQPTVRVKRFTLVPKETPP